MTTIPFFPKSVNNLFVNTANQVFSQIITATGGIVIQSLTVLGNENVIGTSTNNNNVSVAGPVNITGNLNINGTLSIAGQSLTPIPPGTIIAFPSLTLPQGWLFCNGATYQQSQYPELFAAIGTTFGQGFPGTFNVPDMRGRTPVGANMGTSILPSNYNLGESGGTEGVILPISQTPTHIHIGFTDPGQGDHVHTWSATGLTTAGDGTHSHTTQGTVSTAHSHLLKVTNVTGKRSTASGAVDFPLTGASALASPGIVNVADTTLVTATASGTPASSGGHSHNFPTVTGITTPETGHSHGFASVSNVGNSNPHNNMQPYCVFNYIIKY